MKNQYTRKLLAVIATLCTALFASSVMAQDSGCGLGSLIIKRNSKLSQSLAVTTNLSFYTQLFGITSGTSGCSASGIAYNEQEATKYADANIEGLRVDFARGQGENLVAFSQLMGCGSATPAFGEMTRKNYGEIIDSKSSPQMIHTIKAKIQAEPSLAAQCNAV